MLFNEVWLYIKEVDWSVCSGRPVRVLFCGSVVCVLNSTILSIQLMNLSTKHEEVRRTATSFQISFYILFLDLGKCDHCN